jgi:hypothetical protein
MKIYVASSWRCEYQPSVVQVLRLADHEVYDFRNPAKGDRVFHWSEIDDMWQTWEPDEYRHALTHRVAERGLMLEKCEPELMYKMAKAICLSVAELLGELA